ncbi:hypothetical protein P7K49_027140 [Saguinus oedipus]|uniref:Uncharacterized protein n=1 Tax=Saguinus oedipus TaxID=9490 RepID=A0ABQ9UG04_SAGOE|nr:hypothetical protein P7K49_027140 [Saguinus oedipus]
MEIFTARHPACTGQYDALHSEDLLYGGTTPRNQIYIVGYIHPLRVFQFVPSEMFDLIPRNTKQEKKTNGVVIEPTQSLADESSFALLFSLPQIQAAVAGPLPALERAHVIHFQATPGLWQPVRLAIPGHKALFT